MNFNQWSEETISELMSFLQVNISRRQISKALGVKKNAQKGGHAKLFADWSEAEKEELDQVCGDLARQYGYQLQ